MSRPALIFDFGNVIAHFDYTRAADVLGRRAGLTGRALLEGVRSRGFDALNREFESGRITAEAFSRRMAELADLEFTHAEFAAAWADIFTLNEPVARIVAELKALGYTLVLGSNTNALHAPHFRRQFAATLAHFDRLVLSHEIGHIKPAPDFYRACASAAGAAPADCVFIDDLPENVEGARTAGLAALLYRDPAGLRDDLRRLYVPVPA